MRAVNGQIADGGPQLAVSQVRLGVMFLAGCASIAAIGRYREENSLNNNRNNNRRGRGRNNNRNQGGNSNQNNRIDNRARGNAPQLLDKYKKLAQDAQHHGDRVQAEYYLQFADHYFRVIADNKARQEEARAKRQEERGESGDEDDKSDGDERRGNRRGRSARSNSDDDGNREYQNGRGRRRNKNDDTADNPTAEEGQKGAEGDAGDNPFSAEPKRPRKRRAAKPASEDGEIDVSALPPAIGDQAGAEEKPKRTLRRRKTAESEDADNGAASAAG